MAILDTILGSNVGQLFKDVVGTFKLSPEKKAELQQHIDDNKAVLDAKQLDLEAKAADAVDQEVKSAAEVIKAEAASQSWLPRNVRPLLALLFGLAIVFNVYVPIVARYWAPGLQPLALDPWLYKLVVIYMTGYVTARTVEKMFDKN
jgi:Holin of 3TMs, for gene-transfer release